MTETLARPVVPAAEERARLKEGVHIERSSRRASRAAALAASSDASSFDIADDGHCPSLFVTTFRTDYQRRPCHRAAMRLRAAARPRGLSRSNGPADELPASRPQPRPPSYRSVNADGKPSPHTLEAVSSVFNRRP